MKNFQKYGYDQWKSAVPHGEQALIDFAEGEEKEST
jgi:hypothetical protein